MTHGRGKSHRLRRLSLIAGDWYRPPRRRGTARAVQVAATASSLPPNETLHLPCDERPASAARNERPPNAGSRTRPGRMPRARARRRNSPAASADKKTSAEHCSSNTPRVDLLFCPGCTSACPHVQQMCHKPARCDGKARNACCRWGDFVDNAPEHPGKKQIFCRGAAASLRGQAMAATPGRQSAKVPAVRTPGDGCARILTVASEQFTTIRRSNSKRHAVCFSDKTTENPEPPLGRKCHDCAC